MANTNETNNTNETVQSEETNALDSVQSEESKENDFSLQIQSLFSFSEEQISEDDEKKIIESLARKGKDDSTLMHACTCGSVSYRIAVDNVIFNVADSSMQNAVPTTIKTFCASCGKSPHIRTRYELAVAYRAIVQGMSVDMDSIAYSAPSAGKQTGKVKTLQSANEKLQAELADIQQTLLQQAITQVKLLRQAKMKDEIIRGVVAASRLPEGTTIDDVLTLASA